MPRDSGCYESTENLANGREEAETEPKTEPGADKDVETDTQLEAVQEKLQDLTVEEESWEHWINTGKTLLLCFRDSIFSTDGPEVFVAAQIP